MAGASISAAVTETQQFLQDLGQLASPMANANDYLKVTILPSHIKRGL